MAEGLGLQKLAAQLIDTCDRAGVEGRDHFHSMH
jgi:hypothetical protein